MIKVTKDLTKEQIQAIEAIYRRFGRIKAQDILEEARNPQSCLHDLFTWSDAIAAEKYRRIEARMVIKAYRVKINTRTEVRAFHSLSSDRIIGGGYRHIKDIISDRDLAKEMQRTFLAELKSVVNRYASIPITSDVAQKLNQTIQAIEEELE